jgi:hypothetical protein
MSESLSRLALQHSEREHQKLLLALSRIQIRNKVNDRCMQALRVCAEMARRGSLARPCTYGIGRLIDMPDQSFLQTLAHRVSRQSLSPALFVYDVRLVCDENTRPVPACVSCYDCVSGHCFVRHIAVASYGPSVAAQLHATGIERDEFLNSKCMPLEAALCEMLTWCRAVSARHTGDSQEPAMAFMSLVRDPAMQNTIENASPKAIRFIDTVALLATLDCAYDIEPAGDSQAACLAELYKLLYISGRSHMLPEKLAAMLDALDAQQAPDTFEHMLTKTTMQFAGRPSSICFYIYKLLQQTANMEPAQLASQARLLLA